MIWLWSILIKLLVDPSPGNVPSSEFILTALWSLFKNSICSSLTNFWEDCVSSFLLSSYYVNRNCLIWLSSISFFSSSSSPSPSVVCCVSANSYIIVSSSPLLASRYLCMSILVPSHATDFMFSQPLCIEEPELEYMFSSWSRITRFWFSSITSLAVYLIWSSISS